MKARLESMSKLHCISFIVALLIVIVVFFGASFKAGEMLVYDNGDTYRCPQGTNTTSEDLFFSPFDCESLSQVDDGVYWAARLSKMSKKNQIIFVYGYITPPVASNITGLSFKMNYQVHIRGKDEGVENWTLINSNKNDSTEVTCKKDKDICSIFIVAHIPILEYSSYDIMIEILNKEDFILNNLDNIHFKVAYIDVNFTNVHLGVRVFFIIVSGLVCIIYLCKTYRIRHMPKTYDQKSLQWITVSLFFFNDPFFVINIFKPNLITYIVSQLFTAVFFGLLLQYWLRTVEKIKDTSNIEIQRQSQRRSRSYGFARRSPLQIIKNIFFLLFIIDILVLYVIYLFNVKDNPSFSHFQQIPKIYIGLLISTAVFVCIYLIWFAITIFITMIYFCRIPIRSRIMFLFSILMLLICIATLMVGVYSPFYSNGGIFMFFIAIFNIYIMALVYLNWPTDSSDLVINLEEEIEMHDNKYGINSQQNHDDGQNGYQYQKKGQIQLETDDNKSNASVIVTGQREIKLEF